MAKVVAGITTSIDGYITGPNDGPGKGLGEGGERLHYWAAASEELLVKEKELTRARDALAAERRRMPMMAVEKEYAFEGPDGPASLLDLFEGRRQLIVYRFFYEPGVDGWPEHGCRGCSFLADQVAH